MAVEANNIGDNMNEINVEVSMSGEKLTPVETVGDNGGLMSNEDRRKSLEKKTKAQLVEEVMDYRARLGRDRASLGETYDRIRCYRQRLNAAERRVDYLQHTMNNLSVALAGRERPEAK